MAFWIDWQLWEKLSMVLAILIALVITYGCCVLVYNRFRVRRYAAIEARQKEEEAGLYPMLKKDDIPFGARALERGVEVPGIWISSHNTPTPSPHVPSTPIRSRSPSPAPRNFAIPPRSLSPMVALDSAASHPSPLPSYTRPVAEPEIDIVAANNYRYESYRPGGIYSPGVIHSTPTPHRPFHRRSDTFPGNEKRASFHTRILRASQIFDNKRNRSGTSEQDEVVPGSPIYEHESRFPTEQYRGSRVHRILRRRSSEEFRRRISQIFNERIHMNMPAERLQFNPTLSESQRRRLRRSILSPFRSSNY